MAKYSKVKNFIENQVRNWIYQGVDPELRASFPEKNGFSVHPVDKSDGAYKEIVDSLCSQFLNTSVSGRRVLDGLCIIVLRENDKALVCGLYQNGSRSLTAFQSESNTELKQIDLSFLQKILILSDLGVTATSVIDTSVWSKPPIFEKDLEAFMPKVLSFEMPDEFAKESTDSAILRFLFSLDLGSQNARELQPEIFAVLQALPLADHDWLNYQFLSALLSSKDSSFFAELYKLVEFFFPLQNVYKLKESTGFEGSALELLKRCKQDLRWSQNHNAGARSAVAYASIEFAKVMLDTPTLAADKDEHKFKEDAMEKISNLRHVIVHQDFEHNVPNEGILRLATKSILIFLSESFIEYSSSLKKQ